MKAKTTYYIDYLVVSNEYGTITESYFQLVRTKDDAIFYANPELNYVLAECFKLGISNDQVTIL